MPAVVEVVTLSCHTTSKIALLLLLPLAAVSCASGQGQRPRMAEGTISYPFIADTKPIGRAREKRPFIIRSAVGQSEYTVEIPDDAGKYDIQIPLAELAPKGSVDAMTHTGSNGKPVNAATTDKELVAALPSLAKAKPGEVAMLDAAFGVGSPEGPVQSPSYSIGIAKVNEHFKARNYELALVELNNLLAFYPNSPKLLKMKGTLLIKTGNRDLAMKAWQRAADLTPGDSALKRSMNRLNERIIAERNAMPSRPASPETMAPPPAQTVAPIPPVPDEALDVTAH